LRARNDPIAYQLDQLLSEEVAGVDAEVGEVSDPRK